MPEVVKASIDSFPLEKLPPRDINLLLTKQIQSIVDFVSALDEIECRDNSQRPSLDESQIAPELVNKITECGIRAGITEAMSEEFMRQTVWGNFIFSSSVRSFIWVHKSTYDKPGEFVSSTIERLSEEDKILVLTINSFNPTIGSSLAILLGALDERRHLSAYGYGNFPNLTQSLATGCYQETFERIIDDIYMSLGALRNIDRVINALSCCNTVGLVGSSRILAAFRADLSRPVIEALGVQLALVFETFRFNVAPSVIYYAPQFPLKEGKWQKDLLNEWIGLHKNSVMSQAFMNYLGVDPYSRNIKRASALPIAAPLGSSDSGIFVRWVGDWFSKLADHLESPPTRSPRPVINDLITLSGRLKLVFHPKELKNVHQARFGILFGSGSDEVSVRIDLEKGGLALDFGATETLQMLKHVSNINKTLHPKIKHYQQLSRKLGYGKSLVQDHAEKARLTLALEEASKQLSFFDPEQSIDKQIPYFATLLNGFGQITGTRSPESISHHSREEIRRVGGEIHVLSEVFRKFVSDLRDGIKQTPLIPMKLKEMGKMT